MQVRLGASEEIQGIWVKQDVEVDEADLALHFAEHTDKVITKMRLTDKYRLMQLIAESFTLLYKVQHFPHIYGPGSAVAQQLQDVVERRNAITQKIADENE
jgi:hypothetical protein